MVRVMGKKEQGKKDWERSILNRAKRVGLTEQITPALSFRVRRFTSDPTMAPFNMPWRRLQHLQCVSTPAKFTPSGFSHPDWYLRGRTTQISHLSLPNPM